MTIYISMNGYCFSANYEGAGRAENRDGELFYFALKDLSNGRGTRSVSLFLSDVDRAFIENYEQRIEIIRLNAIRRAFDAEDLDFVQPVPYGKYMELPLHAGDLISQLEANDDQIRQFLKHGGYWLGFKNRRSNAASSYLNFGEAIDLDYLATTTDAIARNLSFLTGQGYFEGCHGAIAGNPAPRLIEEYEAQLRPTTTTLTPTSKASKIFKSGFDIYTITGAPVGHGGSGTVFRVITANGEIFAVKVLDKAKATSQKIKRFQNELQFCMRPGSRHIVRVLDYGLTEDNSLFYVMPYYPSTLREEMRKGLALDRVLPLYAQLLDSVEATHLLRVCHRDIKPENLLYDPQTDALVLADFGIAHFQEDEILATKVITGLHERLANFAYAAPEQHTPGKQVDHRADIFASGLILNEMFTTNVPQGTGYRQIKDVAANFGYLDELVDSMLRQEPERRPQSINAVKNELIGRGNEFLRFQQLDSMKREVVPDTEIDDPIVVDPIRAVEAKDYKDRALVLRLNRPINKTWEKCFRKRATSYSANVSSAQIEFQHDTVSIHVTEHFLPQGVAFFKQYCADANEEYANYVQREHAEAISVRRAALAREIREREAKMALLKKIAL